MTSWWSNVIKHTRTNDNINMTQRLTTAINYYTLPTVLWYCQLGNTSLILSGNASDPQKNLLLQLSIIVVFGGPDLTWRKDGQTKTKCQPQFSTTVKQFNGLLTANKLCCSADQLFTTCASVSHAINWIFPPTNTLSYFSSPNTHTSHVEAYENKYNTKVLTMYTPCPKKWNHSSFASNFAKSNQFSKYFIDRLSSKFLVTK